MLIIVMIENVKLLPVKTFLDDRGYINQIIQHSDGVFPKLERLYLVGNFGKGVIRAFHKHEKEWKCFFVINGASKFVLAKETCKEPEIDIYVLSPKNPQILIVPPEVWHGFISLEENTIVLGISNFTIDETKADDYRMNPFKFGKEIWEVKAR
jgi:dTDP-4-dehydrorhamnose 3,5-epimerase-like enzyme